jgi:uncharacterized membrane protein
MHFLKLLAIVVPAIVVIDLIWLGLIMVGFYDQQLGDLARRNGSSLAPRWSAAVLVYLLIPAGIVIFVRPLLASDASLLQAFAWGALYGLVIYGVYDLTNLTTLEKWTWRLTLVDMAWGCVLCGIGGVILRLADRALAG